MYGLAGGNAVVGGFGGDGHIVGMAFGHAGVGDAGLAALSPTDIILHLYYPFLIFVMVIISIIFQFPRR